MATALFKRGFRFQMIQDVHPLHPEQPTLVGEAFFERLSYSNLSNAGLGDLCAFTREQYVQIAVDLAKDRARRLDLRQNLRDRLRTSPLGDAQRWVKNFELTIDRTLGRT